MINVQNSFSHFPRITAFSEIDDQTPLIFSVFPSNLMRPLPNTGNFSTTTYFPNNVLSNSTLQKSDSVTLPDGSVFLLNKDLHLNFLKQTIKISAEATAYLKEHKNLISLIYKAKDKLKEYFNEPDTKYSLNRIYNGNGVILRVHTVKNGEDALEKLDKFEDDWWIYHLPDDSDNLLIDVMFA